MRKPARESSQNGQGINWNHTGSLEPSPLHTTTSHDPSPRTTPTSPIPLEPSNRSSSRLSKSPDLVKRVPPPSIEVVQHNDTPLLSERRSSESLSVLEMPPSGRLTVANPDAPSSEDNTPTPAHAPLPSTHSSHEAPLSVSPKEDLPLPDIPRTDSPLPINSQTSPRPRSRYLSDATERSFEPPQPPSSPPLPELPPQTPGLSMQNLAESVRPVSSALSTVGPSPSPAPQEVDAAASPASTITPLGRPEDAALARASTYVNPPTPYSLPSGLQLPPVITEEPIAVQQSMKSVLLPKETPKRASGLSSRDETWCDFSLLDGRRLLSSLLDYQFSTLMQPISVSSKIQYL